VVQSASLPEQQLWRGDLTALADSQPSSAIDAHAAAILVIGATVDLADTLAPAEVLATTAARVATKIPLPRLRAVGGTG
jgi:hypothetical protein